MKLKIKYKDKKTGRLGGRLPKSLSKMFSDLKNELLDSGKEIPDKEYWFSDEQELQSLRSELIGELPISETQIPNEKEQKLDTNNIMNENKVMAEEIKPEEPKVDLSQTNSNFDNYDFTGITEEIKQRKYNEVPVTEFIGQDVPEPEITNSIEAMLKERREQEQQQEVEQQEAQQQEESEPFKNPAMAQMDEKDKKYAAEQLVDMVLGGYETLHQVGRHVAKFDESKILTKIKNGEIDSEITFPIDAEGNEANIQEYIQIHNQSIDEVLAYDPEFNEKVRPVMVRVFMKHDWGVTDEQYLLMLFAKDIGTKLIQVIQLRKSAAMIIKSLEDYTMQLKANQQEAVSPSSISKPNNSRTKEPQEVDYEQI